MTEAAEGYVTEITRTQFWGRVRTKSGKDLNVCVSRKQIEPKERPFLAEGAYFRITRNGEIRFLKRVWTKTQIKRAVTQARELMKSIRWT